MSNNCQLVAMGQQANIWGRDCESLCSDGGNQFNPACVLNQQALPYWVGRQYSFETIQTENWRVRGIPGFFFSPIWSKGQSLRPHRQSPTCNWVLWLVLYSFQSWSECLCQPWGCVELWNPWFPQAHHSLLPTQFNYSHVQSVSKYNQTSSRVRLSTLLGIWEKKKIILQKKNHPCSFGDDILLGIDNT